MAIDCQRHCRNQAASESHCDLDKEFMNGQHFGDALAVCRAVHGEYEFMVNISMWDWRGSVPLCSALTTAAELRNLLSKHAVEMTEVSMMLGIEDANGSSSVVTHTYAVAAQFNRGLPAVITNSSLSPTIVLRTSPEQFQAVWVFENQAASKRVADIIKLLMVKKWGASNSFARADQLIRLPGFINGTCRQDVRLMPESDFGRMFEHESLRLALEDCADFSPGRWDLLED